MEKIKVRFVGGHLATEENMWGGSIATTTAIIKAFENDPEIDFKILTTEEATDTEKIKEFISDADIVHLDENVFICSLFEELKLPCDIIGPTMRSPVKQYWVNNEKTVSWICPYSADWFYKHKIIRLNYQEERDNILKKEFKGIDFKSKVRLIYHAVDTEKLKPNNSKERKYILWAGDRFRPAKNFDMFEQIMNITELPKGYKFKFLYNYNVKDYWDLLDETKILVNTSKYESFCNAMYEAQAKGVPTVYKKGMHGEDVHKDSRIQVEYTPEAYREVILNLLTNEEEYKKEAEYARRYAETYCSPKAMHDSIKPIYLEIMSEKNG